MKLIFYSGIIPPSSREDIFYLVESASPRLLIIPSDSSHPRSDTYISAYRQQFQSMGIDQISVYKFDQQEVCNAQIFDDHDIVFLSGGDTQFFWENLTKTKTHQTLLAFVNRGGLLLGLSAGSMLMMSNISLQDGQNSGLGLIRGSFSPHYQLSDRERLIQISKKEYSDPIYCLQDDSYMIVDREDMAFRGPVTIIERGILTQPS